MQHISAVIYFIMIGNLIASIIETVLFVDAIRKQRVGFVYFFGCHIGITLALVVVVLLYWSRG